MEGMMQIREQFLDFASKLKKEGLVTEGVNKGSMSVRVAPDLFLISPSKLDYSGLRADQINLMRTDGSFENRPSPISRDSYFHLAIYKARPDVNAIIHTHSKYATALCLAGRPLPYITVGMKFHCSGSVDIAPFAMPNSEECTQYTIEGLGSKKAVLLENHGLVCVGETLLDCYETARFVEDLSESYIHASQLGPVKELQLGKEEAYGKA